jgi:hypothetical protein
MRRSYKIHDFLNFEHWCVCVWRVCVCVCACVRACVRACVCTDTHTHDIDTDTQIKEETTPAPRKAFERIKVTLFFWPIRENSS